MKYTVHIAQVITREVVASTPDKAAEIVQANLGKNQKLLAIYPEGYMPPAPPNNFTPKPPSAPTPGTPTIRGHVVAESIARAA